MIATTVLLTLGVTALSWWLTDRVRSYTLHHRILDIPNARSSHQVPTPRGGGIAIIAAAFAGMAAAFALHLIDGRLALALVIPGLLLAAVGWIDDRRGLSALTRLISQLVAATIAVILIGSAGVVQLDPLPRVLADIPAIVFIVWFTNIYNFMDGIDGLAAGEALTAGGLAAVLCFVGGINSVGAAALILAAASGGFLKWNWSPARIFMGDAGSGVLGFCFGVLALVSQARGGPSVLLWVVMFGAFTLDSTLTLLRRMYAGARWYSAHRQHAYQRAVQSGYGHHVVSAVLIAVVNPLLTGAAAVSFFVPETEMIAVPLAMLLLILLYVRIERRVPLHAAPNSAS